MLDKTQDIAVGVADWLTEFELALASTDAAGLRALFQAESYWRDVLALSWRIRTLNGRDAILHELPAEARSAAPRGFAIAPIARHRAGSRAPAPPALRRSSDSKPRRAAAPESCA
jgi:hypothetical protein